eukprot:2351915-Rhodomonas_salina.2
MLNRIDPRRLWRSNSRSEPETLIALPQPTCPTPSPLGPSQPGLSSKPLSPPPGENLRKSVSLLRNELLPSHGARVSTRFHVACHHVTVQQGLETREAPLVRACRQALDWLRLLPWP